MNKSCIFIKDPHSLLGFSIPSNRQETFFDEIKKKWYFIADYVKKNNIPYIIVTGDLFDKTQMSLWTWKSFLENKKFFKEIVERSGAKIYSIRGNHDELNGKNSNIDTIFETLTDLKIINHFGTNTDPITIDIDNKKIKIFGFDWNNSDQKLDLEIKNRKYDGDYNIAVLHTSVVDTKTGKERFSCISYDHLINNSNKINMWVLGHYHKGFPVTYYKNKYFINSWNLTRLSRVDYVLNDEHTPEFVHSEFFIENNEIKVKNKTIKIPFLKYNKAFKPDIKEIDDILVDNFKFFTKIEDKIEENFDENAKLKEMLKNNEIKQIIYDIIKENLS